MTSIGTGYDYAVSTYSPDGRVFQIEYASKAVDNSGTAIGIRAKDGVVFAVEKLAQSKLQVPGTNQRIQGVERHLGMATSGLLSDAKQLVTRARSEALNYRNSYSAPIPVKAMAERLGMLMHAYTIYSGARPYGCSVVLGGMDDDGPQLYMIDPSGSYWGYRGCASGKGKQVARTELEKLKFDELSARQAIKEATRIIYTAHDEAKDKEFELELVWISAETNGRFERVSKEMVAEAEAYTQALLNAEMDDDE
ncbi:putative proteasome subunit alpha type-7 [Dimargaris xerosporica]|nr:putative proteasome subunit alpha type-7 [Dimargaris xerosporica]